MRDLLTEEKIILGLLVDKWTINLYDLYQSQALSVAQIAQFVKLYEDKGYIKRVGYRLYKTLKGYLRIKQIAPLLYRMSDTSWKMAPKDCFQKPAEINKPIKRVSFKDF